MSSKELHKFVPELNEIQGILNYLINKGFSLLFFKLSWMPNIYLIRKTLLLLPSHIWYIILVLTLTLKGLAYTALHTVSFD